MNRWYWPLHIFTNIVWMDGPERTLIKGFPRITSGSSQLTKPLNNEGKKNIKTTAGTNAAQSRAFLLLKKLVKTASPGSFQRIDQSMLL